MLFWSPNCLGEGANVGSGYWTGGPWRGGGDCPRGTTVREKNSQSATLNSAVQFYVVRPKMNPVGFCGSSAWLKLVSAMPSSQKTRRNLQANSYDDKSVAAVNTVEYIIMFAGDLFQANWTMDPNVGAGYGYQPQPMQLQPQMSPPQQQQQQQATVIIQQPQMTSIMQNSREWSHGLCGCCDDLGECTYVAITPCVFFTARQHSLLCRALY